MDLVKWARTMERGHLPESSSIRERDDSDDESKAKVAKKKKNN